MKKNLRLQLKYIVEKFGDSPAICSKNRSLSYSELDHYADYLAEGFIHSKNKYCVILGDSTIFTFKGIFAAIKHNKTFVPLTSSMPQDLIRFVINSAQIDLILISEVCSKSLSELKNIEHELTIILLDFQLKDIDFNLYTQLCKKHKLYQISDFGKNIAISKTNSEEYNPLLYLMFTSGSTGTPKGVEITESNLLCFIVNVSKICSISNKSRFSHISPISFDFSIYEYLVPWFFGASVYIYNKLDDATLSEYILRTDITHWSSVPTTILYMLNSKQLCDIKYPSIEVSLIGGEAFPLDIAKEWKKVAINSKIFNAYGPTEASVFIASYLWSDKNEHSNQTNIVSIGKIFSGNSFCIGHPAEKDESLTTGLLWITGEQVIQHYWSFKEHLHKFYSDNGIVWYNTGDLIRVDEEGFFHFIGREDDQIQIQGYRIERLEMEMLLKKGLNIRSLAVLPHRNNSDLIDGVILFIDECYSSLSVIEIKKKCKIILNGYWIKKVVFIRIPVNKNNKVDYKMLTQLTNSEL